MGRKNTDRRREEIVEAFLTTMAEHGYARATIARVAETAGLTPGLLHYHFKNKQAILVALTQQLVEQQAARLQQSLAAEESAPQRLRALIDAFLATGASADPDAVAAWVTIAAESIRQPEIQKEFEKALHAFQQTLTAIIEEGLSNDDFALKELTAPAAAAALLATIQGYFTLAAISREVIPVGTAAAATWQMACGLLQNPGLPRGGT